MKKLFVLLFCILAISCSSRKDKIMEAVKESIEVAIPLPPTLEITDIEFGKPSKQLWDADFYVIDHMDLICNSTDERLKRKYTIELKEYLFNNYTEKDRIYKRTPISACPIKVTYTYLDPCGQLNSDVAYFNLVKYKLDSSFEFSKTTYATLASRDYLFKKL